MGVTKTIFVAALSAALFPSISSAQGMSADAIIAACQSRARLTDQWNPLQAERDQLAQTLRNFGFDKTVAEQEALGERAADILRDNGVNMRKDLMNKTASEAATAMQGFLENLETGGRALNNAERGQLQQLARRLPQNAREAIMEIAQAPRIPIPGSPVWRKAFDAIGHASTAHTLATTESAGRLAWEGFMAAASTVNPPMGLVISNLDYAANNLASLGQIAWTGQQIKSLTNATEADLRAMKNATDRMKVVGKELGAIRNQLGALPPCDSTQLVRGDLGPPPAPQVPTPPAPENASNASAGGGNAGAIAGYTAAAAGAGVGLYALNEYQKSVKCTQYETEMDGRMTTFQNAVNSLLSCGQSLSCFNSREPAVNRAMSGILQTAGNWCTCLGPNAAAELSAADKAAVRDGFNFLRSNGINPGTMPACFR